MTNGDISKVSVENALKIAVEAHQRGLIEEAIELYQGILDVVPDQIDALNFLGVATHQMGESEAGLELINRSLAISERQPSALNNLGNINNDLGNVEAAEKAYRKVLELAPDHVDTLSNLAAILRRQKKVKAAHKLLKRALDIDSEHSDSYHNLGNVYRDLDRDDDALFAYKKAIEIRPERQRSELSIARLLFESGRQNEALQHLDRLLIRNPEDALARHYHAAYKGEKTPVRASDDYVRQTFDRFAESFDSVLGSLDYAAPQNVAQRFYKELEDRGPSYRIVDLGCGTGLFGALIKSAASSLIGVDLSGKMLDRARARNVYDELVMSELTQFLRESKLPVDVLTCVDTLVYFGALDEFATAASSILKPDGWLFVSVERHDEQQYTQQYILHPHGRYSHSRTYVELTLSAAGLKVKAVDNVILRIERKMPVSGLVIAARKETD